MNLTQFLRDDAIQKTINDASVVCFQADVYPLLFCRQLISYLTRVHDREIIACDMSVENHASKMASLQTTFLGSSLWYWLHSDEALSKKTCDAWHDYLALYEGPNKLFFFTSKEIKKLKGSWCVVRLPKAANRDMFSVISDMVGSKQVAFADYIYKHHKEILLDTAVLLAQYSNLLGKNWQLFVRQWLHELLVPETSLFSLSQALFAKQPKVFFRQWQQIADAYVPQFWIVFWSEQLWQAYAYIRLQKAGRGMEAKKVAYRLPFSFKNRDWRNYSLPVLQQAHQFLYGVDFHLKNGGNDVSLELFYTKFLQNVFG